MPVSDTIPCISITFDVFQEQIAGLSDVAGFAIFACHDSFRSVHYNEEWLNTSLVEPPTSIT